MNYSIKQVQAIRKCSESISYSNANILAKDGYVKEFSSGLKDFVKTLLMSKESKETMFTCIDRYLASFDKKKMVLDAQAEYFIEREGIVLKRMISFLFNEKFSVVDTNVSYTASVCAEVNGVYVENIYGKADLMLEKDGITSYVNFQNGEPKYSAKARKKENLPENALELLVPAVGFYNEEKETEIRVMLFHLKGKNDKNDYLEEEFTYKNNVVELTVKSNLKRQMLENLTIVSEYRDCKNCSYNNLCNYKIVKKELPVMEKVSEKKEAVFTPAQESVVNFMEGAMRVIAVPGAGKTFSLVNRLAKMLSEGIKAEEILFVTFTNKAALEIEERVSAMLPEGSAIPNIFTFNGLGFDIVRENEHLIGSRFLETDIIKNQLILECIKEVGKIKGFSYQMIYGTYGLVNLIKREIDKVRSLGEEAYLLQVKGEKDYAKIIEISRLYERKLKEQGYISYDEQISLAVDLLKTNASVIKRYAERYKYIMVDEFQDSSDMNIQLVYQIARAGSSNIVVVGDVDQSIYGWRNGSSKYLMEFDEEFPGCKTVIMSDNFRSLSPILEASNMLIKNNEDRICSELIPHKMGTYKPQYIHNFTIEQLPALINKLTQKHYNPGDIAILSRFNKNLLSAAEILDRAGIGSLSPKDYVVKNPVFTLLYDLLTIKVYGIESEEADAAVYRWWLLHNIKLSKKDKKKTFYREMIENNVIPEMDFDDLLKGLAYISPSGEYVSEDFSIAKALFDMISSIYLSTQLSEFIQVVKERMLGVDESGVCEFLQNLSKESGFVTTSQMLDYMQLMIDFDDQSKVAYIPQKDKVNLLTSHESKGKEFDIVLILYTEDYKIDEEERRLLYVSMTRAKKILFMLEGVGCRCEMLSEFKALVNEV